MYTEQKQEYNRRRYAEKKEEIRVKVINYYLKNRDEINARKREKRACGLLKEYRGGSKYIPKTRGPRMPAVNFKLKVLTHYGSVCVCCQESNMKLMTLDHKDGDGHKYRTGKTRRKGVSLYSFLIKENFPQNMQVLCFNCNIGRANNKGICPHKD